MTCVSCGKEVPRREDWPYVSWKDWGNGAITRVHWCKACAGPEFFTAKMKGETGVLPMPDEDVGEDP